PGLAAVPRCPLPPSAAVLPISESFLTVKGAALFLPRGNGASPSSASRFSQLRSKHAGDIQQHLQTMFTVLRPEDNIKLAVRLESMHTQITRYMVVVSTNGRQDTEESVVLGMDFSPVDSSCSVGLVLPLWSDTLIHLDGDGGFSVSTDNRVHVFKPVSVQAMWSALQSLHKACEVARCHNYFPGSLFLTWVSYYQSRVSSDQARINEWNAMQDVQSHRADSPVLFSDVPTERELTERQIKSSLREIMMQKDLENVTCKEIRTELEMHMTCNLREFKEFIDNEMIVILGQMDSPTEIFDHVFLGSEWNASNLEELQNSGVEYILNVTREIDNFFPGVFEYHNIRVYDEEATDLLAYWNDTFKFISRAKKSGSKCLVHCKMGISRSAATVIAYAMKEYGWDLKKAFDYVKERRTVTKPNPSFMRQLEEYQGILLASKQRHNKLWRSHSDSDLSEHHEPLSKSYAQPLSLGRSDPHNQSGSMPGPSVKELLESLAAPGSAGRTALSTMQPDAGIKPSPLSSSLEGVSSLSRDGGALSLEAPEQPSSLPCFQPRAAAAVVPEPQKTEAVTVPQSVSVGQPHPPPSLHRLPTSVSPAPPCREGEADKPAMPSCCQPAVKPEPSSTSEPAAAQPPSAHADHINFFSAREKFKGMSQDGKSQCAAGQPSTKSCGRGGQAPLQELPPSESSEEEKKKVHTASANRQGSPPPPVAPLHIRNSETEVRDVLSLKEAENVREEEEAAPPRLYSDWTRGSVRRVTQQLEQRMKQEHDTPSPSSSPPSLSGSSAHSQRRPHSIHTATLSEPRESAAVQEQKQDNAPDRNGKSVKGDKLQPADSRLLSTSSPFHLFAQSPFASVNFLCLEGVTELESSADWDCSAEGPSGDVHMRETWETLCELGAFLQQVAMGETRKAMCAGPDAAAAPNRGSSIQKRVREVEARIRQAGLTPPSLMKRSASLAKLGCLELLANELSEWEFGRSAAAATSARPPVHTPSDESKKQRVHRLSPSADRPQDALRAERLSKGGETPPGGRLPSNPSPQRGKLSPNSAQDCLPASGPTLLTTRQQYGRTHPLRRLKKRTVSTLYHTM
uniref:protein-serine/threonine phosphatase n=1 Tax=Salarias fasciatus TaxID=181472 RepID=A0A672FLL3_SALFA